MIAKRKKLPLSHRAKSFANRLGLEVHSPEGSGAVKGWLAGYVAAQKDAHAKTYSRVICCYCGQPKDGHKHKFCFTCQRIKEHCECPKRQKLT